LTQKGNIDFGSPNFNQVLMATVLELGLFDPHIERLRQQYRAKIDALLAAADEFLTPLGGVQWVRPRGGLYLWLRLPEAIDTGLSGSLFSRAVAEGVLYVPGDSCYPEPDGAPRNMLRLSFGSPSCATIRRGVEALGRAIRLVLA
jgi:2-aminoadipate transaminase